MTKPYRQDGFTLLELMITVAIIAILASIAYPSYQEYVAKSRRATLVGLLQQGQQWMERFYTENYRYDETDNRQGGGKIKVTDASQFPSWFSVSPKPGDGGAVYDIAVTAGSRDAYSIKATRKPGTGMANDRCGDYVIDQYGRKKLENYDAAKFSTHALALAYCWK